MDETTINIEGTSQYVWVITDGTHVIFKLSENREATIAHELLSGYSGVLCSDFYGGYDSVPCVQQKCWVHLIRDLNENLRKSPFDTEYEKFVCAVGELIVAACKHKSQNLQTSVFSARIICKYPPPSTRIKCE
jgi:hypothetical protein